MGESRRRDVGVTYMRLWLLGMCASDVRAFGGSVRSADVRWRPLPVEEMCRFVGPPIIKNHFLGLEWKITSTPSLPSDGLALLCSFLKADLVGID